MKVAQEDMELDKEWVSYLSTRMYEAVMSRIPEVTLNGDHEKRYPGNLNFSFAYVEVMHGVPKVFWFEVGHSEKSRYDRVEPPQFFSWVFHYYSRAPIRVRLWSWSREHTLSSLAASS